MIFDFLAESIKEENPLIRLSPLTENVESTDATRLQYIV